MLDDLRSQRVINWCCICRRDVEIVDHLLLHRDVARVIWRERNNRNFEDCEKTDEELNNFYFCILYH